MTEATQPPQGSVEERRKTICTELMYDVDSVKYREFKVIYGEVVKKRVWHTQPAVFYRESCYDLIPMTDVVIILEKYHDETKKPPEKHAWLHVFSKGKWQVITLY